MILSCDEVIIAIPCAVSSARGDVYALGVCDAKIYKIALPVNHCRCVPSAWGKREIGPALET